MKMPGVGRVLSSVSDDDNVEVEAAPEVLLRATQVEQQLFGLLESLSFGEKIDDAGEEEENEEGESKKSNGKTNVSALLIPKDLPIFAPHAYPCSSSFRQIPPPPTSWPQGPIMIRPTPGSETRIRGIRYAESHVYQHVPGFCAGCILPVNNGSERPGKSLVIDFETSLFVGTLMLRIRGALPSGSTENYIKEGEGGGANSLCKGYFDGKKRTFQVVVKGRFKTTDLKMSEFFTGQSFERSAGRLPAKWLVTTFIHLISILAPQLEASFGNEPRFLSPLVATAHVVQVRDHEPNAMSRKIILPNAQDTKSVTLSSETTPSSSSPTPADHYSRIANYKLYPGSLDMEEDLDEPDISDPSNILHGTESTSTSETINELSSSALRKLRKKTFNNIAAKHASEPCFDVDKEYTFEFYQHMLLLAEEDDIKLVVPTPVGKQFIGLSRSLNGQPLKILGAQKDPSSGNLSPAWSFDLWHRSLYDDALQVLGDD